MAELLHVGMIGNHTSPSLKTYSRLFSPIQDLSFPSNTFSHALFLLFMCIKSAISVVSVNSTDDRRSWIGLKRLEYVLSDWLVWFPIVPICCVVCKVLIHGSQWLNWIDVV